MRWTLRMNLFLMNWTSASFGLREEEWGLQIFSKSFERSWGIIVDREEKSF